MRKGSGITASHRCLIARHSLQPLSQRRAKRIPRWIGSRRVACVPIPNPCEATLVKPRPKLGLFTREHSFHGQRPYQAPSWSFEARIPSQSTLSRCIVRRLGREHWPCGESTYQLGTAFRIECPVPKDFDTLATQRGSRVSREVELCTKLL